jgi:hypothetical protein
MNELSYEPKPVGGPSLWRTLNVMAATLTACFWSLTVLASIAFFGDPEDGSLRSQFVSLVALVALAGGAMIGTVSCVVRDRRDAAWLMAISLVGSSLAYATLVSIGIANGGRSARYLLVVVTFGVTSIATASGLLSFWTRSSAVNEV